MHRCPIGKYSIFSGHGLHREAVEHARSLEVDHGYGCLRALGGEIKTRLIERQPKACALTSIGQRGFELAQEMEGEGACRLA